MTSITTTTPRVWQVDPKGPNTSKLQVGDKIIAVDGELLNFRKFVEVVDPRRATALQLRIARLRVARSTTPHKSKARWGLRAQRAYNTEFVSAKLLQNILQVLLPQGTEGWLLLSR